MSKHRIIYDLVLKRPECVLLQAAMGGSVHVANLFPNDVWLLAPTPNMRGYEVTDRELAILVDVAKLQVEKGTIINELS